MPQPPMTGVVRFGVFELEPRTGILSKHGVRIRLQEQPFRVMLVLLERPGEPVSREELRERIWADTEFGDFDHSLNIAINKIREALGDSAEAPRFVETLPRRGYRFIAPVEPPAKPLANPPPLTVPLKPKRRRWAPGVGAVAVVGAIAAVALLWPTPTPRLEWQRLTNDISFKIAPILTDGARLFFRTRPIPELNLLQVPISGGAPTKLAITPPPGPYYRLLDLSRNGEELLMAVYESTMGEGCPLWATRFADGSSRRIGSLLVQEAAYSPDGTRIAFTAGGWRQPGSLWVAAGDGADAKRLLEWKGVAVTDVRWSPDGSRIAFGQLNRATGTQSAWTVRPDGTSLGRLFPDWAEPHSPAGWTRDGSLLLNSRGRLWMMRRQRWSERGAARRIRLSSGEPVFAGITRVSGDGTFFALGTTPLGELQRYDTRTRSWIPHLGGVSGEMVEYSRDRKRVSYATYPEGELWVRNADGSRPVQLTRRPMQVLGGRWSPDGRTIACVGKKTPDEDFRIYLVDTAGGGVHPASSKEYRGGDVVWLPDGRKLVFAAPAGQFATEEPYLRLLDLDTGEIAKFPGSDGLYSPRVSPDGASLAALVWNGPAIALHRFGSGVWNRFPIPSGERGYGWPAWSHDGESIWYWGHGSVVRYRVRENRHEDVMTLEAGEWTGTFGSYFSLTPGDQPMILRRRDVQQIYALEIKGR